MQGFINFLGGSNDGSTNGVHKPEVNPVIVDDYLPSTDNALEQLITDYLSTLSPEKRAEEKSFIDSLKNLPPDNDVLNEAAIKVAERIGAREYEIDVTGYDQITLIGGGCQGNADDRQRNVADLQEYILEKKEDKKEVKENKSKTLYLGIANGDDVYPSGATAPNDPAIKKCFHDIYGDPKRTHVSRMHFIAEVGNHDERLTNKIYHLNRTLYLFNPYPTGYKAGINLVAHHYLGPSDLFKEKVSHLIKQYILFSQKKLPVSALSQFNLPWFFNVYRLGETKIFTVNSNSYARDYLKMLQENVDPFNQARWIAEHYQPDDKAILMLHNPFKTSGKRALECKYDTHLYLEEHEINELNKSLGINPPTRSHSELLYQIFKAQGIKSQLIDVAHDHTNSHYIDDSLCQITSGGNGDRQPLVVLDQHPSVSFYLEGQGIHAVTFPVENVTQYKIDYYVLENSVDKKVEKKNDEQSIENISTPPVNRKTIESNPLEAKEHKQLQYWHVRFHHNKAKPVHKHDNELIKLFRNLAIEYCDEYLSAQKKLDDAQKTKELLEQKKAVGYSIYDAYNLFSKALTKAKKTAQDLLWYPPYQGERMCVMKIKAFFMQYKFPSKDKIVNLILEELARIDLATASVSFKNFNTLLKDESFFAQIPEKKLNP